MLGSPYKALYSHFKRKSCGSYFSLFYMQARYYDPVIGRFYSNDPLGYRDLHSFNRYAYVNNNPYAYVDPTGMCAEGIAKNGCTITGKASGSITGTEIDPASPVAVNSHAMVGNGTSRQANFANVDLSDLGASIQKFANASGSQLANAINTASVSGNAEAVNITGLKAGGGFDGDTSLGQKGGIGRFSVVVSGHVTADSQGNWKLTGTVTGEPDIQDYPYDASRTGAATAATNFGASVQSALGGKDFTVNFVGSQTIKATGP
jgi:RHS repeat-associated protein